MLLDSIFGPTNFVNELAWKRYGAHNDVVQGSKHYGRVQDTILFYAKNSSKQTWTQLYTALSSEYSDAAYRYKDDDGRRYRLSPLTGPGGAEKGNPVYEWNGHTRAWRIGQAKMQAMHDAGQLVYSKTGYVSKKLYLDQSKGTPVQTMWTDISSLSGSMVERMGYPTQKPIALMERIVSASSNPGDVVLDPFCGCGTTIHAAQKLSRKWIGIDITHIAISLIEKRLNAFDGIRYIVHGSPQDAAGAAALAEADKHQFQLWAVSRIDGAQPFKGGKKGADGGIDGLVYFKPDGKMIERAIVSVKGGGTVGVGMVKDLIATVNREKAKIGIFITLTKPTKTPF